MSLPSLHSLVALQSASIKDVLLMIDLNAQGVVFLVDNNNRLSGVLTDGDIRRAFLQGVNLLDAAHTISKKTYIYKSIDTPSEDLLKCLNEEIRHIPLVDSDNKLVDYASFNRIHRIPIMEPSLHGNELSYIVDCVKTKWISSQGKYVYNFESMFANLCGVDNGLTLAVSNGTVALHLALVTLGIGPGDEVIVPNLTFAASINSILHAGATPVIVDVAQDTWCIDIAEVQKAITKKTKAIMPVHLYGHPCNMDELNHIAKKYNLSIIEDAAEALGSMYKGKPIGTQGDISCFSFFGNKMITTGEGGMLVFKNAEHAEHARLLRDHGMTKSKRYWHTHVGYNYRMTNLQAAIGVAQLEQFDNILERKLNLAKRYNSVLKDISGITLPPQSTDADRSTHWLYTILLDPHAYGDRDNVIKKMSHKGIETRPVFYPLNEMPPYIQYAGNRKFPVTSHVSQHGLSLPSSADITEAEVLSVAHSLKEIFEMRKIFNT